MDADCDGCNSTNGPSLKHIEEVYNLHGAYNAVHSPVAFPNDGTYCLHLARAMAAAHGTASRVVGNGEQAGDAVTWQAVSLQNIP
jgi:hypothetical protein